MPTEAAETLEIAMKNIVASQEMEDSVGCAQVRFKSDEFSRTWRVRGEI